MVRKIMIFSLLVFLGVVSVFLILPPAADGQVWQSVGPGGGGWLSDVKFHPSNPQTILTTLDCGGVRISKDTGTTWILPTKGFGSRYGSEVEGVFVQPKKPFRMFLTAWTGIYRSTDGGLTWGLVLRVGDGTSIRTNTIAFDPDNANVLYAGSGSTRQSLGFVNVEGYTGSEGVVWYSTNGGKTWKTRYQFPQRLSIYTIIVDGKRTKKDSDNRIILFTNKGLYSSTNGGKTFEKTSQGLPDNLRQAVQSPHQRNMLWATVIYGGVYQSKDFGKTWKRIGPEEKLSYVYLEVDPNTDGKHRDTLLVSAQNWQDVGGVWEGTPNAQGTYLWRKIFPHANIQMAWNTYEGPAAGDVAVGYPRGKRTILLISPGARLFKSSNNGASWEYLQTKKVGEDLWKGGNFELMILAGGAVDPRDGTLYFSYVDMGTFKSRDAGYSWKQLKAGGHFAGGNPESVAVNPLTGEVFVSVDGGKVLSSSDGGETFNESLPELAYQFAFDQGGTVYAATKDGVFSRGLSGGWQKFNGQLLEANSIVWAQGMLYAANNKGVWKISAGKWEEVVLLEKIIAGGIVVDPSSGAILIATLNGMFIKEDNGVLREVEAGSWEAIEGVGSVVYAKSRDTGIWRSDNFGQSWKNVTDGVYQDGYEQGLVVDPRNSNIVYYGSKCMGVFKRDFSKASGR